MKISFIIVTDGHADTRINEIIDSIEAQAIPTYDVTVIGGMTSTIDRKKTIVLGFDESVQPQGWITRKKNLATKWARWDNIVYLHDYHVFDRDWYQGVLAQGEDYEVQMHQIRLQNDVRMLDWLTYDHPVLPRYTPLPYDRHDFLPWQYISGGYWMARKSFMQANPLNEALMSHQGEDVEWSLRIREKAKIVMNPRAIVRHNKPHRELAYQPLRMVALPTYDEYFRTTARSI